MRRSEAQVKRSSCAPRAQTSDSGRGGNSVTVHSSLMTTAPHLLRASQPPSDELHSPRRRLLTHLACAQTQTTVLMDSPGAAAMAQVRCPGIWLTRALSLHTRITCLIHRLGPPRASVASSPPPLRSSPPRLLVIRVCPAPKAFYQQEYGGELCPHVAFSALSRQRSMRDKLHEGDDAGEDDAQVCL